MWQYPTGRTIASQALSRKRIAILASGLLSLCLVWSSAFVENCNIVAYHFQASTIDVEGKGARLRRRIPSEEEEDERTESGVTQGVIHTGKVEDNDSTETERKPAPTTEDIVEGEFGGVGGPFDAFQVLSSRTAASIQDRCDWLWNEFQEHTSWMTSDQQAERYEHQVTDASNYYRATSHIFWIDFVLGNWSHALLWSQLDDQMSILDEYATYTWVSGDQHLLNFGAWRNRHGDIVYGMNDFDEGAVFDFQVDVVRLAVSIYDQVLSAMGSDNNGVATARRVIASFVDIYVRTVRGYVGNEDALTSELTPETASGTLQDFLKVVRDNNGDYSRSTQLEKYTKKDNGKWRFKKGTTKEPKHKLAEISPSMEETIRQAFSATEYGGSLLKFGWSLTGRWNDDYYEVLDVAARIGSGVGSYGVDRYYVLVRGENSGDDDPSDDLGPFILDVKHQPPGSFRHVITPADAAWYDKHFTHAAARVTEAQRRLTAFTDPFSGWILLGEKPFTVRERSPWKEDFDMETLVDEDGFLEFVAHLGTTTATSHVRGNVGQAPGDFKNVIDQILGDANVLERWSSALVDLAALYHEQVQLDFKCFESRLHPEA